MKNLKKDQQGLTAIIVTMFILIMLSLIVLAFSQITRRETRQALDRQLSSQAFYAAESGINEATKYIRQNPLPLEKVNCNDPPTLAPSIDTTNTFGYSCILFDRAPTTIEYSGINTESGEFVSLKTLSNDLSTLTITWNDTDGGNTFSGCPTSAAASFPAEGAYGACDAGVMRVLLMPFANGINRQQLTDASYTAYLRPMQPGKPGTTSFANHSAGANTQGNVVEASCDTAAGRCTARIEGVPGGNGLFLHMKSIYKNSVVTVGGFTASGATVRFTEAQAKIDSTGKVSDVLKRMQVRIPLLEKQEIPGYVVQTMNGICKQLDVYQGFADYSACGGIN